MIVQRRRLFVVVLGLCTRMHGRSGGTANDSSVAASSDGADAESGPTKAIDDTGEILDGEHADGAAAGGDRRVELSASFSGPLPPPAVLAGYDDVVPGLAREIVDQWKAETAHRHATIEGLRSTDRDAMLAYYKGERRGQYLATLIFLGIIGVAVVAVVLNSKAIGVAAIVAGGASAIWAMRRRSSGPSPPIDLEDGDAVEEPSDT